MLLWLILVASASAAEISLRNEPNVTVVKIEGRIIPGDSSEFARIAGSLAGRVLVVLNSPGGTLLDGLVIGETINHKGYYTGVADSAVCTSSCGLIWLAGKVRLLGNSARIGFHAAYTGSGDAARETGAGNALVGAYLTKLGLSYGAIAFLTEAAPGTMNWLHPEDAQRVGIEYVMVPAHRAQ